MLRVGREMLDIINRPFGCWWDVLHGFTSAFCHLVEWFLRLWDDFVSVLYGLMSNVLNFGIQPANYPLDRLTPLEFKQICVTTDISICIELNMKKLIFTRLKRNARPKWDLEKWFAKRQIRQKDQRNIWLFDNAGMCDLSERENLRLGGGVWH